MLTQSKFFALLNAQQRKKGLVVLFLMSIGMTLEMIGIGMILPVLGLVTDPNFLLNSPKLKSLIATFGSPSAQQITLFCLILLGLIYFAKNAFLAFLYWLQSRFVFGLHANISQRLFVFYINQPYTFHLQNNSAKLIRNVIVEVNLFTNALQASMVLVTEALVLLGIFSLLLFIEPIPTILVTLVISITATVFYFTIRKKLTELGNQRQVYDGKRIMLVQEGMGSIKEITVLRRKCNISDRYKNYSSINSRILTSQYYFQQLPRLWLEILAVTSIVLLVVIFIAQEKESAEYIPVIGLFSAAAFRILPSMNRILTSLQSVRYANSSINKIYHELSQNKKLNIETVDNRGEMKLPNLPQISFANLYFRYPETKKDTLKDVNFTIKPGTTIGIIGESGAGKSTLVDILLGLLEPTQGKIFIDNKEVKEIGRSWQRDIGYVPQNIFLSDCSILENIGFGLSKEEIKIDRAWAALKLAQIDEFVRDLPHGIDNVVGEKGVKLSGGQKQRIGIARALYNNPSLLILDEATSALDIDTENDVLKSVKAMKGTKTIIIITHRLSAISICDEVFRLKNYKIVKN